MAPDLFPSEVLRWPLIRENDASSLMLDPDQAQACAGGNSLRTRGKALAWVEASPFGRAYQADGIGTMALRVFRQNKSGDEIIQLAVRLALLAFLLYWSFVLVRPFIPMLAWSMVLTVALYPPYNWLSVHLGGRQKLSAAIVTVTCLLIIIGPATWLGLGMIEGLQDFAGQLGAGTLTIPSPPEGVKDWPILGAQIYGLWEEASTNLAAVLRQVAPHLKPLAGPVLAFAGSAGVGTLKFILSVALSGFLFLYGPRFVAAIRRVQARLVA